MIQLDFIRGVTTNINYLITIFRINSISQECTGFINMSNLFSMLVDACLRDLFQQWNTTNRTLKVFVLHTNANIFFSRFTKHTTNDLTTWLFHGFFHHIFVKHQVASLLHVPSPLPQYKKVDVLFIKASLFQYFLQMS